MVAIPNRPLKRYTAFSFRGGLDTRSSPQELATNPKLADRLTQANHVVYLKSGAVNKRYDEATYNTTTLGTTVGITGGFMFRHSNGTDYNICGTDDGRVLRLNTDGTTTSLATGLTTGTRWYFDQFNDTLMVCNRADAPRTYDGTTFGTLGGSPPATGGPVVVHGNRGFMLDSTNTRRLSWSALSTVTDWTTASNAGSLTVSGKLGSPLISILPMTGELLLLHRDFVTRLQGTSPSTYALTNAVPAQTSIGTISPQGAVFGNNDAWWISQRGIHNLATTLNFGDLLESFASEPIDPYFVLNSGSTASLNQLSAAVSAYDPQNNRLYWGIDTDADGKNDLLLVLDVFQYIASKGKGGWSVWPSQSCASLWAGYTGANGVEIFMGGYDGFVRVLNRNISTNAFSSSFKHISALGAPTVVKSPRHLMVYLAEQGSTTINVTTTADFGAASGTTYSVSQLGNSATLGSTFTLGTSVLGKQSQIVKRINTSGVGEFWEVQFANATAGQNFTVHGYEWLWRERRQIPKN